MRSPCASLHGQADAKCRLLHKLLKSPSFYSRCQAENPHILRVLAMGDEFRERIGFCRTHEKFGKCLAQRFCRDEWFATRIRTSRKRAWEQRRRDIGGVPGRRRRPG